VLPAPSVPVVEVPVAEPGVTVIATRAAEGVARDLARGLGRERADLARILGADRVPPLELRFGQGRAEFDGLLPGGAAPPWASGLAYPGLGLVIVDVQASGRGGSAAQVLRHELAHVALDRAGGGRLPRWFSEGFAIVHSGEWSLSRSVVLGRAVAANALLPVEDLERGWPSSPTDVDLAYAQSVSLVTFLLRVDDGAAVHRLVARLGEGQPFPAAFRAAFGQPVAGAEVDWKRSLRARWGWLPIAFDPNLLWGLAAILVVLGALRAHRRHRRRLAAMPDDPEPDELDEAPEEWLEPTEGLRPAGDPLPRPAELPVPTPAPEDVPPLPRSADEGAPPVPPPDDEP
jgi:hypothetical protein